MALVAEYGYVNTELLKKYTEQTFKLPTITPPIRPVEKSLPEQIVELGKGALTTLIQGWIEKEKQKIYKTKTPKISPEYIRIQKEEEERKRQMIKFALIAGGIGLGALAIILIRKRK